MDIYCCHSQGWATSCTVWTVHTWNPVSVDKKNRFCKSFSRWILNLTGLIWGQTMNWKYSSYSAWARRAPVKLWLTRKTECKVLEERLRSCLQGACQVLHLQRYVSLLVLQLFLLVVVWVESPGFGELWCWGLGCQWDTLLFRVVWGDEEVLRVSAETRDSGCTLSETWQDCGRERMCHPAAFVLKYTAVMWRYITRRRVPSLIGIYGTHGVERRRSAFIFPEKEARARSSAGSRMRAEGAHYSARCARGGSAHARLGRGRSVSMGCSVFGSGPSVHPQPPSLPPLHSLPPPPPPSFIGTDTQRGWDWPRRPGLSQSAVPRKKGEGGGVVRKKRGRGRGKDSEERGGKEGKCSCKESVKNPPSPPPFLLQRKK